MNKQPTPGREEILVRCARLYYKERISKSDIAKKLSISAMQVTRLLREAESRGIVKIDIFAQPNVKEIQQKLIEKYNLLRVTIVETSNDYGVLKKRLGEAAAKILEEQVSLRPNISVGIGGGSTIYEMIEALEDRPRHIAIYPMAMIGRGPEVTFFDSAYLCTHLLLKSRPVAKAFVLGIPPLPSVPRAAKIFVEKLINSIPEINTVLNQSRNVDLAFVGLGGYLPFDEIIKELSKVKITNEKLKELGAVGGINYNYFDSKGKQIGHFLLTVTVDDLRKRSSNPSTLISLVAGGKHKFEAIRTAIRTKMVNSLITDLATGEQMLVE